MSVDKTIRVSYNLQEDVHAIKDGREGGVLAIVFRDLVGGEKRALVRLVQWTHPLASLCVGISSRKGKASLSWSVNTSSPASKSPPLSPQLYLFCKPDSTGLSDPLPGMDASVNPDRWAVGPSSAELEKRQGNSLGGTFWPGLSSSPAREHTSVRSPLFSVHLKLRGLFVSPSFGELWDQGSDRDPVELGLLSSRL